MACLGFRNLQLRCLGDTNSRTIYEVKLVGNSPEICRGLDLHGFADLEASVLHHTAFNSYLCNRRSASVQNGDSSQSVVDTIKMLANRTQQRKNCSRHIKTKVLTTKDN